MKSNIEKITSDSNEASKSLDKDTFVSSPENSKKDTSICTDVCNLIDPGIVKAIGVFFPLIKLISDIANSFDLSNINGNTKEETISQLHKTIDSIKDKVEQSKDQDLTKKTSETLERLCKTMEAIEKNKNISNKDIKDLIHEWRENKDHKTILELAMRIGDGKCESIKSNELKQALKEALESFATALEEAKGHPPCPKRDKAIKALEHGAGKIVDNVEIIDKKGDDSKLSKEEKKLICSNFKAAKEKAKEVIENPELSVFVKNSANLLQSFIDYVDYLTKKWEEEEKEEELREKEEKEQKLCDYRTQKRKETDQHIARLRIKEKESSNLRFLKEEARRKLSNLMLYYEYNKEKTNFKSRFEDQKLNGESIKRKYLDKLNEEDYYKSLSDMTNFQIQLSYLFDETGSCGSCNH